MSIDVASISVWAAIVSHLSSNDRQLTEAGLRHIVQLHVGKMSGSRSHPSPFVRCMRPVVIGAVLALCISVVPQQARADERTVLMNVGGDPPASLSSACISLIHSLPRLEGAPSQLDAIRMDNSQSEEDMKQYAIGLLLPIGIIILLALLTWGIWIGFCCDRWCYNRCDRCGGREATRQYTSKDQLYLKIGSIILLAASLVLFFIGLVSNAQISSSTDDTYVNSDKLVEHVFRLNAPLGDMRAATDDAYSALQSFNATLFAHLPSPELADAYVACVHTVYGQVQREGRMMLGYNPVTESGYPIISLMPQQIAEMETTVSNTLVGLQNESSHMQSFNTLLSTNLPNPLYEAGIVPATNFTLGQMRFQRGVEDATFIDQNFTTTIDESDGPTNELHGSMQQYVSSESIMPLTKLQSLQDHILNNDSSSATQSEVHALNDAVAALPSVASSVQQQITTFQSSLDTVRTATSTLRLIMDAIQISLKNIDIPVYTAALETARDGVPNIQVPASLVSELQARHAQMRDAMNQSNVLVESILSANQSFTIISTNSSLNDSLRAYSKAVNSSLASTSCIQPLYDDLLAVNGSMIIFDPHVVSLLDRRSIILTKLQHASRIHSTMAVALSKLPTLQAAVETFPDMDVLLRLNQSLSDFPDTAWAATMLQEMQHTLTQVMTPTYLNSILAQLAGLQSAMDAAASDVANYTNAIHELDAAIYAFPTDFTPFSNYGSSIAQRVSDMSSDLATVTAQVNTAGWVGGAGISEPTRSSFLVSLDSYIDVFAARPNHTQLTDQLDTFNTTKQSVRANEGNVTGHLIELDHAVTPIPPTQDFVDTLRAVWRNTTSSSVSPLPTLLDGSAYTTLEMGLNSTSVPSNWTALRLEVDATATSIGATRPSFQGLVREFPDHGTYMSEEDSLVLEATVRSMEEVGSALPDVNSTLDSLGRATSGLADAQNTLVDSRHDYYVVRQTTVRFKNRIDWLRLLAFLLIMFVPVCIGICGIVSWAGKKPILGLYMGVCSFSIVAIFLVMGAIHLLPALFFADQCTSLDSFISNSLNQYGLDPASVSPWLNLSSTAQAGDIFLYASTCGPRPELFDALSDPQAVLDRNGINFTAWEMDLTNAVAETNGMVVLTQAVWDTLDAMEESTDQVVASALEMNSWLNCSDSSPLWTIYRDSICSPTGISGALALSTCICVLFALCTTPGVCIGIMGFKRFDPKYFTTDPEAEYGSGRSGKGGSGGGGKIHQRQGSVADPYAAGLAERPMATSSGQNGSVAPGLNSPQVINPYGSPSPFSAASPSLAVPIEPQPLAQPLGQPAHMQMTMQMDMQPGGAISTEQVELQPMQMMQMSPVAAVAVSPEAMQQQRPSLQFALASAPEADPSQSPRALAQVPE